MSDPNGTGERLVGANGASSTHTTWRITRPTCAHGDLVAIHGPLSVDGTVVQYNCRSCGKVFTVDSATPEDLAPRCDHKGPIELNPSAKPWMRYKCTMCGQTFAEDPNAVPEDAADCSHSHTINIDPLSNEGATLGCLDCGRKFIINGEQGGLPGGSTPSLYALPKDAVELQDLIEYRGMNFAVGNIFKACYRLGMKRNVDAAYDLRKIIFFAERELRRIENLLE